MSEQFPRHPNTKSDFVSDQQVRWCPGCGDYAILSMVQRTLAKLDLPKENYVFLSGIGCSSRFPYYMNTYGFHAIHGRALTIGAGLKCVNPKLSVWVITGDGDGLSIGTNHLIHALRKNLDLKVLLVNNRIYGLTKGQYSPTSEMGKKTRSSPFGTIERPINAMAIALASEATFVARAIDTIPNHLGAVLERAALHKGSAFVEIYQNCLIFNDKAYDPIAGRDYREDRMVQLQDGQPLIFGKEKDRAIRIRSMQPEVVKLAEVPREELCLHDEKRDPQYAHLLAHMEHPELPVPIGVFRAVQRPTYETLLEEQIRSAVETKGPGDLRSLIYGADTWRVA